MSRSSYLMRAIAHAQIFTLTDSFAPGAFGVKPLIVVTPGIEYIVTIDLDGLDASSLNRLVPTFATVGLPARELGNTAPIYQATGQAGQFRIAFNVIPPLPGRPPIVSERYSPVLVASGGGTVAQVGQFRAIQVGELVEVFGVLSFAPGVAGTAEDITITLPSSFPLRSPIVFGNELGGPSGLDHDAANALIDGVSPVAGDVASQGAVINVLSSDAAQRTIGVAFSYETVVPPLPPPIDPIAPPVIHFITASLISGVSGD
jgi:hypothetical protein